MHKFQVWLGHNSKSSKILKNYFIRTEQIDADVFNL